MVSTRIEEKDTLKLRSCRDRNSKKKCESQISQNSNNGPSRAVFRLWIAEGDVGGLCLNRLNDSSPAVARVWGQDHCARCRAWGCIAAIARRMWLRHRPVHLYKMMMILMIYFQDFRNSYFISCRTGRRNVVVVGGGTSWGVISRMVGSRRDERTRIGVLWVVMQRYGTVAHSTARCKLLIVGRAVIVS